MNPQSCSYTPLTPNPEHQAFEISLFAELFHEMLQMRAAALLKAVRYPRPSPALP